MTNFSRVRLIDGWVVRKPIKYQSQLWQKLLTIFITTEQQRRSGIQWT